eukprot:3121885-Rhodomonas_salina.1
MPPHQVLLYPESLSLRCFPTRSPVLAHAEHPKPWTLDAKLLPLDLKPKPKPPTLLTLNPLNDATKLGAALSGAVGPDDPARADPEVEPRYDP